MSRRTNSRPEKWARSWITRGHARHQASIVDLAVRGLHRHREHEKDRMLGLMHDKDTTLSCKRSRGMVEAEAPRTNPTRGSVYYRSGGRIRFDVQPGKSLLHQTANIKKQHLRFANGGRVLQQAPGQRTFRIYRRGLHRRPSLVFGGVKIASDRGMAPLAFIIAGLLTGVIGCAFGWFMPRIRAGNASLGRRAGL